MKGPAQRIHSRSAKTLKLKGTDKDFEAGDVQPGQTVTVNLESMEVEPECQICNGEGELPCDDFDPESGRLAAGTGSIPCECQEL